MAEEWLTLEEAAAYLKVAKPTIYRFCSEGCLPFYKLAGTGQRRFKRADLDALFVPGRPTRKAEPQEEPGGQASVASGHGASTRQRGTIDGTSAR